MATGNRAAGAFSAVDSVVGRVARIEVFKGEVIVGRRAGWNRPGPRGQDHSRKRAVAVRIDVVWGNGLVQPTAASISS
jgi:hypothetical protein